MNGDYVVRYKDGSKSVNTLMYSQKYQLFNATDSMSYEFVRQVGMSKKQLKWYTPLELVLEYLKEHPKMDYSESGRYVVKDTTCDVVHTLDYSKKWNLFNAYDGMPKEHAEKFAFTVDQIEWCCPLEDFEEVVINAL